jgi:dTDP-L-rhamnose 4-epimerase
MRFFNVIGPGQSLSNPYTGIAAIFLSRLLNGNPPLIYEDGLQSRDFINVRDVARVCADALLSKSADDRIFNIGTGLQTSVLSISKTLGEVVGVSMEPEFVGRGRKGDVRHCFADISAARSALGFSPKFDIRTSLEELHEWSLDQHSVDLVDQAHKKLSERGLG